MRGVGNKRKSHLLARGGRSDVVGTQVVLDISSSLSVVLLSSKLVENTLDGPADDVGENVETTTVWHTNGDAVDTVLDGSVDEGLDTGNERLTTLETETLLVGYLEAMKRSNESDQIKRSRMVRFSSTEYLKGSGVSMRHEASRTSRDRECGRTEHRWSHSTYACRRR